MKNRAIIFIAMILFAINSTALSEKAPLSKYSDYLPHLVMHIGERSAIATGNYIKMRERPKGDKVVGHLEIADTFSIDDVFGKWVKITVLQSAKSSPDSWNGLTGWVDGNYIDCRCSEESFRECDREGKKDSQAKEMDYDPALTESCSSYQELIDLYSDAYCNIGRYSSEYLGNFFVEPYTSFSGYVLFDVNRDGIEELLFMDKPGFEDNMIYAVYTMKNGKTHRVFDGWSRNRLYLLEDGTFLASGSSGAAYSSEFIYEIRNGKTNFLEGYASSDFVTKEGEYGWGWFKVLDGSYPALGITENMIPVSESEYESWEYPAQMNQDNMEWIAF